MLLLFLLKIIGDLFGNLVLTVQPSCHFQMFKNSGSTPMTWKVHRSIWS
jgi:hypothetical protein